MSRSYRVTVCESLNTTIKAHDRVCTQLELLEVLPPEAMAELLARALEERGFTREGDVLAREVDGVKVTVDPRTGEVTASSESARDVEMAQNKEGRAYDDMGPNARAVQEQLRKEAQKDLERKADEKTQQLQTEVTNRLERTLNDIRRELDQVVNRVTGEALKQKAASLGKIKEMSEDQNTGNLTIVLEV